MTQADNFKMISIELQCGAMCGKGGVGGGNPATL